MESYPPEPQKSFDSEWVYRDGVLLRKDFAVLPDGRSLWLFFDREAIPVSDTQEQWVWEWADHSDPVVQQKLAERTQWKLSRGNSY